MKKMISLVLVISVLLLFVCCQQNSQNSENAISTSSSKQIPLNPQEIGQIKRFEFGHSSDVFCGDYVIENVDETILFSSLDGSGNVELTLEITQDTFDELAQILVDTGVLEWNGFNESVEDLYDGYGFRIYADYENATLSVSGYGSIPDNYIAAEETITQFFKDLTLKATIEKIKSQTVYVPADQEGFQKATVSSYLETIETVLPNGWQLYGNGYFTIEVAEFDTHTTNMHIIIFYNNTTSYQKDWNTETAQPFTFDNGNQGYKEISDNQILYIQVADDFTLSFAVNIVKGELWVNENEKILDDIAKSINVTPK